MNNGELIKVDPKEKDVLRDVKISTLLNRSLDFMT